MTDMQTGGRKEPVTPSDAMILDYLTTMDRVSRSCLRDASTPPHGWVYFNNYDFLLQHGLFWTFAPLPRGIGAMTSKYCFDNAFKLASRTAKVARAGERLGGTDRNDVIARRYVEGVAFGGLIPMDHAWCVNREHVVLDPTWDKDDVDTDVLSYFGVAIALPEVARRRSDNCCSFLQNYEAQFAHLRTRFNPELGASEVKDGAHA